MKTNKYYYLSAILMMAAAFFAAWQIRTSAQSAGNLIQLSLKTEKEGYALGEVIGLNFDIKNMSDKSLAIDKPSVRKGNLRLFISNDGENYREYQGPNWGMLDSSRRQMKLGAGDNFQIKETLLYNYRVPTEHLTELYAERIRKQRIGSEFALPNAGRYWLKAVFTDAKIAIESEPLAIDVSEPIGLDAVVWEKMKSDGAFAYFLHTGQVLYLAGSAEAQEFVETLQRIASDYPDANLTHPLEQKLDKYRQNVEYVARLKAERESGR